MNGSHDPKISDYMQSAGDITGRFNIVNHSVIIAELVVYTKLRKEFPDTPDDKLELTIKYQNYIQKAFDLLEEISKLKDERDETKIVVLKEFFDIPDQVWRLF